MSEGDIHQKLIYSIIEYLNDMKNNVNNPEAVESIEVAVQCLSDSFNVDLQRDSALSIKPLNLPSVFALGLTSKEQIAAALAQQTTIKNEPIESPPIPLNTTNNNNNNNAVPSISEIEQKFNLYCEILKSKGYFNGVSDGSKEYVERLNKAKAKFIEKIKASESIPQQEQQQQEQHIVVDSPVTPPVPTPAPVVEESREEKIKKAEEYKTQGNSKLSSNEFAAAIEFYTKAIEYDDTNAIYYSNRAAAYSHLNDHQAAIEDCQKAIERNPNYSKAHSRLGLAHFSLGNYAQAAASYREALALDPNNASVKQSLQSAEQKLTPSAQTGQPPRAPGGIPGGLPGGLADLMNNPTMQNMAQQMQREGLNNPNDLFNNPNLMNMAQNLMQQPGMSEMLNNPAMMNMAQSFMQNPDALSSILQGVFGKGGGGGGGGGPK